MYAVRILAASLLLTAAACDATADGGEEPAPEPNQSARPALEDEQKASSREAYKAALAQAPVYTSPIRTALIENGRRFNKGADVITHNYRRLDKEFRCVHDPEILESVSSAGWELVSCSRHRAVFLRPRNEPIFLPRQCSQQNFVTYEYDQVTISFADALRELTNVDPTSLFPTGTLGLSGLSDPAPTIKALAEASFGQDYIVFKEAYTTREHFIIASFGRREKLSFEFPFDLPSCPLSTHAVLVEDRFRLTLESMTPDAYQVLEEARSINDIVGGI